MTDTVFGNQSAASDDNDFNVMAFVFQQLLADVAGPTFVRVVTCSNSGGVSAVGTVSVQPLVNQMTGNRQAVPHGEIFNMPYWRLQGGANAVIMDPQPGDIGLAVFCSRDTSIVERTKAQANPGSFRMFDWADGVYLGGFLNGVPEQYVQFTPTGINIVSTGAVTVNATTATVDATTVTIGSATTIDGRVFLAHTHSGVQIGGGVTGPVV